MRSSNAEEKGSKKKKNNKRRRREMERAKKREGRNNSHRKKPKKKKGPQLGKKLIVSRIPQRQIEKDRPGVQRPVKKKKNGQGVPPIRRIPNEKKC